MRELRIVHGHPDAFLREDQLGQFVLGQACNPAHVLGNTLDAVQQNLAGLGARISDRQLQVDPVGDDVVLGARMERAHRYDSRQTWRQFPRHQRLQRQHDLAFEDDGVFSAMWVRPMGADSVNDFAGRGLILNGRTAGSVRYSRRRCPAGG